MDISIFIRALLVISSWFISLATILASSTFNFNLLTIKEHPQRTWINYVSFNDTNTVINICSNNFINDSTFSGWINIDPNTYINNEGHKHKLINAEGIALSPNYTNFEYPNQTISFNLIFPRLNIKKQSFDLIENDYSDWKFLGIQLHRPFNNNSTNIYYAPNVFSEKLYLHSDSLMRIGYFEEAIEINLYILDFINENEINSDNILSTIAYCLASCFNNLKNDSSAIYFSNLAINIYKTNNWEEDVTLGRIYDILADVYAREENYITAIKYGEEALRIKKIKYPDGSPDLAHTYSKLKFYYNRIGDNESDLKFSTNEILLHKPYDINDLLTTDSISDINLNIEDKCYELHLLSLSFFEDNDFEKAKEIGERVVELWKKSSLLPNRDYLEYVNFLSLYYAALKDYKSAISTALSVKNLIDSINLDAPDYLAYASNLSCWYSELSNYVESEFWATRALEIANEQDSIDCYDYAKTLNTLARCKQLKGNFGEAIDLYFKAYSLLKNDTINNLELMSSSLFGLSYCYGSIGQYKDAIKYGNLSLCIREKDGTLIPYANQLLDMSRYYKETGDFTKALDFVEKASTIYKEQDDSEIDYLIALRTKAWIYYELGNDSLAFNLLKETYSKGIKLLGEDDPEISSFLFDYVNILISKHEYNKSIELLKQILQTKDSSKGKQSKDYLIILEHLILSYAIENQFDEVKPLLTDFIYLLQEYAINNFNSFSYENRNSFWEDLNFSLERMFYVATCLQFRNDSDMAQMAYNISLLSKGLLLSSQLILENTIRELNDEDLNRLLSSLKETKLLLLKQNQNTDNIKEQIDTIEKVIVKEASKINNFKWPLEYNWEDIHRALKEAEVSIEYFKSMSYYYAIVLRKEWDSPKVIELFKNEMIDSLTLMGYQLYNDKNSKYAYTILFAKIDKYLRPGDTIYFSPSGIIHQINLECLQDMSGNMLCETYELIRLSSTRQLINKKRSKPQRTAALYGGLSYDVDLQEMLFQSKKYNQSYPHTIFDKVEIDSIYRNGWNELPETKKEVDDIKILLDKRNISCSIFTGTLGNEESFKSLSDKDISIIHLSTHGFFMKNIIEQKTEYKQEIVNTSLLRSGLLLSASQKAWIGEIIPNNIEDGILFAEEISNLNLSGTDLVVLSACQTGLGLINNEGVWGLQRAFKLAGVKSIIMSLWKVDDVSTRLFMVEFYKNYLSGKSKIESLYSAQKHIREFTDEDGNKLFEDPSQWASFILLDGLE